MKSASKETDLTIIWSDLASDFMILFLQQFEFFSTTPQQLSIVSLEVETVLRETDSILSSQ
ncbi:hypothetical protein QWY90_02815 [Flavobacterium paronense]|uniref:Uncharacterized protein n=1 Tax=Flavobacterium paronense TaxID=1392775 RepID=A0ABV5GCT5_9FLAO|nr:hypothetical protein [Flavobacterium paronense]MDN3676238.1 hypothetical protein [Flavobacterium paronense]